MSSIEQAVGTPAVFGCAGPVLLADEARFFGDARPAGFILFKRNCEDPDQVRALVAALRAAAGWAEAPVLIDQEGGRVQRLRPPIWRAAPAARRFGLLYECRPEAARRAAWLNARLIAAELTALGIDVDCWPVLDRPVPMAHDVIGDRALSLDTRTIASLGRAIMEGLLAGGVLPVIKHLPGHGRAEVDSHLACPIVSADAAELEAGDLLPFQALADAPFAMTAHVVYPTWDASNVATWSPNIIARIIRERIGFEGCLLSDDLSMDALEGAIDARAARALAAGCDLALHCNGALAEMTMIAAKIGTPSRRAIERLEGALARRTVARPFDVAAGLQELASLLADLPDRGG